MFGIICTHLLDGLPQEEWDADNYGKVMGQIVDPITLEPINEIFKVIFYDSQDNSYGYNVIRTEKTNENGRFVLELVPYIYYVQFCPMSDDSKYCESPYPFNIKEEDRNVIQVEKGKITYIQKKATISGSLKIYMADSYDTKFNPEEKFDEKFHIITTVKSPLYIGINVGRDDLDDGELTVKKLHPGIYSVEVEFEGLGYCNIKRENILVEKDRITEVLINIDLNDNTGIEGVVTDANGIVIEEARVSFMHREMGVKARFVAVTNMNGYYKIRGIPVGYYYMAYSYKGKTKGILTYPFKNLIEIKKGILSKLDINFKYTKDELEDKLI
jgi:hypothetical protein